jgi:hypothetical protein
MRRLLVVALFCVSGCCSTGRCHLARSLTAIEAVDRVALPAIEAICTKRVAACGKVEADKCEAYQRCHKAIVGYRAGMNIAGKGLSEVNKALAELGVP